MATLRAPLLASTLLHAAAIGWLGVFGAGVAAHANVVAAIEVQPDESSVPVEPPIAEPLPAIEVERPSEPPPVAEPGPLPEPVEPDAFAPPPAEPADSVQPPRAARPSAWLQAVRRAPPAAVPVPPEAARVLEVIPGENPPPDYPWHARRRGLEGLVVVAVQVDALGTVVAAGLARSSGHPILDSAALRAVRGWRFRGGPGSTQVEVEFVLRGE